MRIVLADDEPLARARLAALLAQCEGAEVVASVGDAEAALEACTGLQPELLLLDIRMPGLDGLQLARRLAALPNAPQVVFCTAFEAHAVDAYDVRAADYLLKPVRLDRLRRALERVAGLLAAQRQSPRAFLHARLGGEETRIALDDVHCLLAEDKYVAVLHARGRALLEDSLRTLEQQFPQRLLRLHRGCLVPRERLRGIKTLADGRVVALLAGSDEQPEVSRRNLPAIRRLLRVP
ncbi:MAG TPA: LytTR family DNA-binding domain-containing protein [Rhodanobacteraceae bacterium]|nr:LytTR family DNA-binding domain-containing protein [Rhodanobacteraceae bacterium]